LPKITWTRLRLSVFLLQCKKVQFSGGQWETTPLFAVPL
jgi:hypothetical protein